MKRIYINKIAYLGSDTYNAVIEYDDTNIAHVTIRTLEKQNEFTVKEDSTEKFRNYLDEAFDKGLEATSFNEEHITDTLKYRLCFVDDDYSILIYELDQTNEPVDGYDDLIKALKEIGIE